MKLLVSLLLCLSFLTNAFAECENATTLRKGDVVKDCDRIGYSMEYDKTVRSDLVEGDYNKKIVEEQKKIITLKDLSIDLNQKQGTLWREEAIRTRKELDAEKNKGDKSLWIGITMGILICVAAGYAIGQVAKVSQ